MEELRKPREHRRPQRVRILTLGDVAVGKSCLIRRFSEGSFLAKYIPTIGVDYGVKEVPNGENGGSAADDAGVVVVEFWDTSGHPDFLQVRNEFYQQAQSAVLVYDIQSKRSFESLPLWESEMAEYHCSCSNSVYVVGTKRDAAPRKVTEAEAKSWCAARGYPFFEVSAFTGEGINELFARIIADSLKQPQR